METEYIENEMTARGIWKLLRILPNEKIDIGMGSAFTRSSEVTALPRSASSRIRDGRIPFSLQSAAVRL